MEWNLQYAEDECNKKFSLNVNASKGVCVKANLIM